SSSGQKRSGCSREKNRNASRSGKPRRCMKRQTLVDSMNSRDGSQSIRHQCSLDGAGFARIGGRRWVVKFRGLSVIMEKPVESRRAPGRAVTQRLIICALLICAFAAAADPPIAPVTVCEVL